MEDGKKYIEDLGIFDENWHTTERKKYPFAIPDPDWNRHQQARIAAQRKRIEGMKPDYSKWTNAQKAEYLVQQTEQQQGFKFSRQQRRTILKKVEHEFKTGKRKLK